MTYHVIVDSEAETAIEAYARYLAIDQQVPQAAANMLERIWDVIDSLEAFPHRCPLALENDVSPLEIRMLRIKSVLLLYTVDEDNRQVSVLAFRHGRQEPIDNLGG